jgi:hypothetical protein
MIPNMSRSVSILGVPLLIILVASRAFVISAESVSSKSDKLSTATETRLIDPGWWPTKGNYGREQYVGSETCGRCHQDRVATQTNTPMAQAVKPATADAFTNMPHSMHFRTGSYDYSVSQTDLSDYPEALDSLPPTGDEPKRSCRSKCPRR